MTATERLQLHADDIHTTLADLEGVSASLVIAEDRIASLEEQLATQQPGAGQSEAMPTYVPVGWKVAIAEEFEVPCAEGQFGAVYGPRRLGFYPSNYKTTRNKQGRSNGWYSGTPISVKDGVLTARMSVDSTGRSTCVAIVPKATTDGLWGDSAGMIIQQRVQFEYDPSFKSAQLLWPKSDKSTRPSSEGGGDGEIDFIEFEHRDKIDIWIHHQGATTGSDQKGIATATDPTQWNTIEHVWQMGKSCTSIHNGVIVAAPYLTRIPATPMHCVLQNEEVLSTGSVIKPGDEGFIRMKWLRVLVPA